MAVNGFDFMVDSDGELILDSDTHDFAKVSDNSLKCQLAYTRIKSCVNDWFYDEVGADLEELVGRNIQVSTVDTGKQRIIEVLTYDGLWDNNDIFVQAVIKNSTQLKYIVYLRVYTDNVDKSGTSVTLDINLDLVKGVKVRYGWKDDNKYLIGGRHGIDTKG